MLSIQTRQSRKVDEVVLGGDCKLCAGAQKVAAKVPWKSLPAGRFVTHAGYTRLVLVRNAAVVVLDPADKLRVNKLGIGRGQST